MTPPLLVLSDPGPVGSHLVRELTARRVPVRVLVDGNAEQMLLPSEAPLEWVADWDRRDTLDGLFADVDRVALLSGPNTDQVARHGAVIEAAERTERPVHLVYVAAAGAVLAEAPLQVARWQAVTTAQIRSAGLPLTEMRPQLLMQRLLGVAESIRTEDLLCGSFGGARLPMVDARDVAAAVAAVLTTDGHEGETYLLTGPQALSYDDVARALSTVLGRPIRYVDLASEAYHEHLIGGGLAPWMADDLAALARLFRSGCAWPVSSDLARLTGRPARTLTAFLRTHAPAFRRRSSPARNGTALPCAMPLCFLPA
jgi:uncharacterized protein YbjT (DUF2867 family)